MSLRPRPERIFSILRKRPVSDSERQRQRTELGGQLSLLQALKVSVNKRQAPGAVPASGSRASPALPIERADCALGCGDYARFLFLDMGKQKPMKHCLFRLPVAALAFFAVMALLAAPEKKERSYLDTTWLVGSAYRKHNGQRHLSSPEVPSGRDGQDDRIGDARTI